MRTSITHAVATILMLSLTAGAVGQPVITGLNGSEFPRSRRVAVTGTGFGTEGQVVIAGQEAWTTTWTDARVVTYVPETAPLGPTSLRVVTAGQASNDAPLTVTMRQPDGRVRWTFEADTDDLWWRPALAPDGTVYIHTNNVTEGIVYAVAPNGGLTWVQKVNWYPKVPPTAGPDGAVYVGSINSIYRISSLGQVDWIFDGVDIQGSPTAGPDGMIYGAFEIDPGAFAIDPGTAQLEWGNLGVPDLRAWGMHGTGICFGRPGPGEPIDRFYIYWDALWAFSLDGDQLFVGGLINGVSSHEPVVGSDGTLYAPNVDGAYLAAVDPSDGSVLWETNDPWLAGISDLEIASDDTLYFISDGRWVDAFDPGAQTSLWRIDTGIWLTNRLSLSPDDAVLVVTGGGSQGQLEFVKGFDASNGAELWHVDLQPEWNPNFRHVPLHHARISADSLTAYVPTWTAQWPIHDGDPRALLFAIDIGDGTPCPADVDGSGTVDGMDVVTVILAWGMADPAADVDGDGVVGGNDLVQVILAWGACSA